MSSLIYLIPIPTVGLLALVYAAWSYTWVLKRDAGNTKMVGTATSIAQGAYAFLKAEYAGIAWFVVASTLLLYYLDVHNGGALMAFAFVLGASFSAFSGFFGMQIATQANVRTAQAARKDLAGAFHVAFSGGTVMGAGVAGLVLLGLGLLFISCVSQLTTPIIDQMALKRTVSVLTGFSLGAESVALFARVAGGIYTKAADVGADIVGKLEASMPEDDPRNPATIADNVGDNVGDVAGMGADLFGSYVATILSAMLLGVKLSGEGIGLGPMLLPLFIGSMGTLCSLLLANYVRIYRDTDDVQAVLNSGNNMAILLTSLGAYPLVHWLLPANMTMGGVAFSSQSVYYTILMGLAVGALMNLIVSYFTTAGYWPVNTIIRQSITGHGTNIIAGLSVGMLSTVLPMLLFAAGIYYAFMLANFYGVAMAAAGMVATTAMQLAIDAFGPIADNAGGIAELCGLDRVVRQRTDRLDTAGNTTAATGKGFAIASAALASLSLFAAFVDSAGIAGINVCKAPVLAGLFIGGMVPFLFSALVIGSVGRAARAMVQEVRRQFSDIPGLRQGKVKPDYERCVTISTQAALREMILPAVIAFLVPICIGLRLGTEVLGAYLVGVTISGVLMALFQSNAGGAWDNAKKAFERGVVVQGRIFQKGSEAHKASISGDTVGDPFKDTSGPSMNILIKITAIIALIILPFCR